MTRASSGFSRVQDYIVVTAPVGAVVDRLPQGVTRIQSKPAPVWYFFGTFFGEKGDAYEVLKPQAGLTVFYLPDGYSQEKVKGADSIGSGRSSSNRSSSRACSPTRSSSLTARR